MWRIMAGSHRPCAALATTSTKTITGSLKRQRTAFCQNDSDLFVALNNFETAYTAYRAFQDMMESYWAMVWLQQENVREINAVLLKDDLVRLEGVPLVARATGIPMEIAPKSMLKLAVQEVDTETQFVALKYLAVVPNAAPVAEDDESA